MACTQYTFVIKAKGSTCRQILALSVVSTHHQLFFFNHSIVLVACRHRAALTESTPRFVQNGCVSSAAAGWLWGGHAGCGKKSDVCC